MSQFKNYKRKLRWKSSIRKEGAGMDPSCPKCGSMMQFRDGTALGNMWPEGAWECTNPRCWNMIPAGELAPDTPPPHLDTGQSDLTLPEHWGGRKLTEVGHDPYQDLPVVAVVLNPDGSVYDQCWNWETGQNYAQQGYRVIALQDDPGAPSMTVERQQAMYDAENGYRDDLFGEEQRPQGLTDAIHSPESVNAEHPDPWMDNEPGTMTLPEHWGGRKPK